MQASRSPCCAARPRRVRHTQAAPAQDRRPRRRIGCPRPHPLRLGLPGRRFLPPASRFRRLQWQGSPGGGGHEAFCRLDRPAQGHRPAQGLHEISGGLPGVSGTARTGTHDGHRVHAGSRPVGDRVHPTLGDQCRGISNGPATVSLWDSVAATSSRGGLHFVGRKVEGRLGSVGYRVSGLGLPDVGSSRFAYSKVLVRRRASGASRVCTTVARWPIDSGDIGRRSTDSLVLGAHGRAMRSRR